MTRLRVARRYAASVVVFAIVACGGSSPPTTPEPTGNTPGTNNPPPNQPPPGGTPVVPQTADVDVTDNTFTPSTVTIQKNGTVTWNWKGSGYAAHNVTFTNAAVSGADDRTTGAFAKTFPDAGNFPYRCTNHTGMNGTIVVQ